MVATQLDHKKEMKREGRNWGGGGNVFKDKSVKSIMHLTTKCCRT